VRFAVYLPWLLSLAVALPGVAVALRGLPDRLDPRPVLVLLTSSLGALALATTASLGLLVAAGVSDLAHEGPLRSPDGHADPAAVPAGLLAAALLALAVTRLVRTVLGRRRRHRLAQAVVAEGVASPVPGVLLVEEEQVFAVATAARPGRPGRVVVSRGLWTALDDEERAAVLAHEQEHLDGSHHRYLAVAALAIALNPLLAPWWCDVVYSAERCADEAAARRVADRPLVARAVGRAALAARACRSRPIDRHGALLDPALGVTGGPVPRRVGALLAGWDRARDPGSHLAPVLVAGAVLLTFVALAAAGAVHAAWDLGDLLGAVPRP
jgi:hypothetical protein